MGPWKAEETDSAGLAHQGNSGQELIASLFPSEADDFPVHIDFIKHFMYYSKATEDAETV